MIGNPITNLFIGFRLVWRVQRALKAKLPFDDLDSAERAAYLRGLDRKTFHPRGIPGIQEAELRSGNSVVVLDDFDNVVEHLPDGDERILEK